LLSCEFDRVLYVGDAIVDVASAKAAGCRAIFAAYDADDLLEDSHQNFVASIASSFGEVVEVILHEEEERARALSY
jgi:phosphoglycolate phosphatase-like HAD superfamily hydrolase